MGSGPDEEKSFFLYSIDQKPIGRKVAFSKFHPPCRQAAFHSVSGQFFFLKKNPYRIQKYGNISFFLMAAFKVFFELSGAGDS